MASTADTIAGERRRIALLAQELAEERREEVRLADLEVNDVAAFGFQRMGARQDLVGAFGLEAADAMGKSLSRGQSETPPRTVRSAGIPR